MRDADAVMRELYVRRVAILIARLSTSACYGCIVDHPSQRQHDVCLLQKETLVDRLFEEAVSSIQESDIVTDWRNILKLVIVDLPEESERYAVLPWLFADWTSSSWIDDMKERVAFHLKSDQFTFPYGWTM